MDTLIDAEQDKRIPPGLIPFKPGVSGNPGGRPKFRALSKAAREELDKINPVTGLTAAQEIVNALIKEAKRGNVWAARELRDWSEGKLPQTIQAELTPNESLIDVRKVLFDKLVRYGAQPEDREPNSEQEIT